MILTSIVPSTPVPPKFPAISCFQKTTRSHRGDNFQNSKIPARDRVIDLGKYRGRMLGSLPSSYLNWISKNLRAGDTEEWANLADEVLCDAVYRDRMEWEFAENVLRGNNVSASMRSDAVSALLDISERFGWDNEDKAGWSKIDFGLLGTSKGSRIPRLNSWHNVEAERNLNKEYVKCNEDRGGRRKARRERAKQLRDCGSSMALESRIGRLGNAFCSRNDESDKFENRREDEKGRPEVSSPFPGREALMAKVLNKKGFNH